PQDLGIERPSGFQLPHVFKLREFERRLKDRHVRGRLAQARQKRAKLLGRLGAQGFVTQKKEITAPGKFLQRSVHGCYDGADPEKFIAQLLAHAGFGKFLARPGVTPRYLQIKRNEGIARIASEEDNRGATEFFPGNQILATDFVPQIALRPMLKQIVRINNARNLRIAISLRLQGEFALAQFAKVSAEKRPDPGPAAFWNRDNKHVPLRKGGAAAAQIPSRPKHPSF